MRAQLAWCGRIPAWSMSGFVRTMPRPLAGRASRVARRVAVVDDGSRVQPGGAHQLAQTRLLIARERLRRKEIERARVRVLGQRLQDREVKAEALAARRRRRDDDVPSGHRRVDRACLMRVEALDPARPESAKRFRGEGGDGRVLAAVAGSVSSVQRHGFTIELASQRERTEDTPCSLFQGASGIGR